MAAATVTSTSYGYKVTGGTDATTVSTGRLQIKAFLFVPDDDDDSVALTDYAGNAIFTTVGANADEVNVIDFYDRWVDGLKVTLNDDGNVLLVLVA